MCGGGSLYSISSPAFVICRLLMMVILTSVKGYLAVVLICISLMISNVEDLSILPVDHLYVFFGEMSSYVFCPLFDWIFFILIENIFNTELILCLMVCQVLHSDELLANCHTNLVSEMLLLGFYILCKGIVTKKLSHLPKVTQLTHSRDRFSI